MDGVTRQVRTCLLLLRHGLLLGRSPRLLRWRLETFGLYMPSYIGWRPWWRINVRAALALLGQLPSYLHWLAAMEAIRRGGGPAWWHHAGETGSDCGDTWLTTDEQGEDA